MNQLTKEVSEETAKEAEGLLQKLFGPTFESVGMWVGQGIRERLVRNQIRGMKRVQEICEKENFDKRHINIKLIFPFLEGIAVEEEPELEKLWTNLMVNYLDKKKNLTTIVYPSILKQMSSREAEIFKQAFEKHIIWAAHKGTSTNLEIECFDFEEIANLERLGIIKEQIDVVPSYTLDRTVLEAFGVKTYEITYFGEEFYKACQR